MLISDERVPEHFRVLHALAAFTGMRMGEAVGVRWRAIDTAARPLWKIDLRTQYEGRPLKGKSGRPGNPRSVPVHDGLRAILALWRAEGWARTYGRDPRPEDFVVLNTYSRRFGKPFTADVRSQFLTQVARVGIEREKGQGFHSFRRFFITYARADGARKEVVEKITHNARGEIVDGYTWLRACFHCRRTSWQSSRGPISRVSAA